MECNEQPDCHLPPAFESGVLRCNLHRSCTRTGETYSVSLGAKRACTEALLLEAELIAKLDAILNVKRNSAGELRDRGLVFGALALAESAVEPAEAVRGHGPAQTTGSELPDLHFRHVALRRTSKRRGGTMFLI